MAELELPNPHELGEIKEKAFTRRVAMVTAVFAVILAIASLGGTYTMKEMLLAQQQASNHWSYYQAKVIREHLYRSQKMLLQTILLDRAGSMKPEVRDQIEGMIKKMAEEEARYGLFRLHHSLFGGLVCPERFSFNPPDSALPLGARPIPKNFCASHYRAV